MMPLLSPLTDKFSSNSGSNIMSRSSGDFCFCHHKSSHSYSIGIINPFPNDKFYTFPN